MCVCDTLYKLIHEISCFHGSDDDDDADDDDGVGFGAMYTHQWMPTFWRNMAVFTFRAKDGDSMFL
jgi:hypothetical protein